MNGVVVENLTVRYGSTVAVQGASFVAPVGRVTAVLGPNGAGKTSTIEVCEGFRRADSGHVAVLGLDPVAGRRELVARMGVMLQSGGVYPSAKVRDVIAHFCALHDRGVHADDLVEQVGLAHRAGSSWRRLSGGEQQRVSLALALAARPDVAFLDEPTSGVDVDGRDLIRSIVRQLAGDGCTVVLASHELAEAERVADNVVMFRAGHVVAHGPLDTLLLQRSTVRFVSTAGLDTVALSARLGHGVNPRGNGAYEIDTPGTPHLVAALTAWLMERSHPLDGLDAGRENLEDAYRRVTGGGR
ncbi:MAG: ABC transporter ATP-binding protein [Acidimicrobiales bacterium]